MQDRIQGCFIILLLIFSSGLMAQLTGTVYDENGDILPFVTIYKEGTSQGTVSNLDGQYALNLEKGKHKIIYKFIGFAPHMEVVDYDQKRVLDIVLKEESIKVDEIVISADAEDPAYRVIRQAIKNRERHRKQAEKYEVDLYVKGVVKMLKTPEKIFGQKVGDMDGMLDTTGQGIVYLGESQSKIYFHSPNLLKEEMYSSIVAEDDGSFNFNRFIGVNYDIYKEYYEFGRSIINPIADNALLYYKYKLLGARFDEDGNLVNRILVIPKSSSRPTLFGEIYIIENLWNVKELDLSFTGKAIKEPFFDTIRIRQLHLPVQGQKRMVFSQTMDFRLGGFGFKIGGGFTYVFSDYNLNPDFDKTFFDTEEFRMDESAINTDSSFWTSVRPIQLTEEEKNNYIKKDSLKRVWASKEYKDSTDRVNNKFGPLNLLFGYTHNNTFENRSINYDAPLQSYSFNPITGHNLKVGFSYVKLDSIDSQRFSVTTSFGYGFSDKRLKLESSINLRTNRKFFESWSLRFGDIYEQFDERGPAFSFIDSWSSLFYKENKGRYYNKRYLGLNYQKEVYNGIFLRTSLTHARRSALSNNTEYSFRNKEKTYFLNIPDNSNLVPVQFDQHNVLEYALDIRFRIGQKYASYPKFRIRNPSKWPDIWLYYRKGISLGDTDYDKLTIRIRKDDINYKLLGFSNFNIEASTFLNKNKTYFIDAHHFLSNSNLVSVRSRYMRGFKLMPHYVYSTTNDYVAGFYEHNWDGFLLDLIPLVNKLGWKTVMGGNALIRSGEDNYYELSAGISDVKIGSFSLFRLDYVWSFGSEGLLDRGFVIGLSGLFE